MSARERVVLDLEATCWDARHPGLASNQRNESEIIEIGAVRSDGATFRTLVRPRRHPTLSPFCTELTGVTQEDVDQAPRFPEAYAAFLAWCGGDEGLVLASWGAFDDRQLRLDCRRHDLAEPRWEALNVKALYARRERQRVGLGRAITELGGSFQGTPHRALDDALNVGWVLERLQRVEPAG